MCDATCNPRRTDGRTDEGGERFCAMGADCRGTAAAPPSPRPRPRPTMTRPISFSSYESCKGKKRIQRGRRRRRQSAPQWSVAVVGEETPKGRPTGNSSAGGGRGVSFTNLLIMCVEEYDEGLLRQSSCRLVPTQVNMNLSEPPKRDLVVALRLRKNCVKAQSLRANKPLKTVTDG